MKRRLRDIIKRGLRDMASFHAHPAQVARGAAVGTFIAFTPTLGIQLILAVFVATALRANRAAALAFVWITNAFTALPIYTFCYTLGRRIVGGPGVSDTTARLRHVFRMAGEHEAWDIFDRFRELLNLGGHVLWPMTVGGILVGLFCGVVVYVATRLLIALAGHLIGHHHRLDTSAALPESKSQVLSREAA